MDPTPTYSRASTERLINGWRVNNDGMIIISSEDEKQFSSDDDDFEYKSTAKNFKTETQEGCMENEKTKNDRKNPQAKAKPTQEKLNPSLENTPSTSSSQNHEENASSGLPEIAFELPEQIEIASKPTKTSTPSTKIEKGVRSGEAEMLIDCKITGENNGGGNALSNLLDENGKEDEHYCQNVQYLVRWSRLTRRQDTWERAEHLSDDLIAEYHLITTEKERTKEMLNFDTKTHQFVPKVSYLLEEGRILSDVMGLIPGLDDFENGPFVACVAYERPPDEPAVLEMIPTSVLRRDMNARKILIKFYESRTEL